MRSLIKHANKFQFKKVRVFMAGNFDFNFILGPVSLILAQRGPGKEETYVTSLSAERE